MGLPQLVALRHLTRGQTFLALSPANARINTVIAFAKLLTLVAIENKFSLTRLLAALIALRALEPGLTSKVCGVVY